MNKNTELASLIISSIEGSISDDDMARLNSILLDDQQARHYYFEYIDIITAINQVYSDESFAEMIEDSSDDIKQFLSKLEEKENTASAIELPAINTPEKAPVIENKKKNSIREKYNKIYKQTFSLVAALLIFFIAYAHIFPPKPLIEVGTITDLINVQWGEDSQQLTKNDRILNSLVPYILEKGIIKLKYDQGVDVVIEAPAMFQAERLGIYLEYGKLYSYVSKKGQGFTIDSPNARFIDLGTEFGVDVSNNGSSEVHVLKGEVQFYAGMKGKDKTSRPVKRDQALRYDSYNSIVKTIPFNGEEFVRNIDSSKNLIWRGQNKINLADIVGGGNGLGTGTIGTGINLRTGKYVRTPSLANFPVIKCQYTPVSKIPFVDGIFVPNGKIGDVTINSSGHTYSSFNRTKGDFRMSITNGPAVHDRSKYKNWKKSKVDFYLMDLTINNIVYGPNENPALYMHSNCGLTFDLNEFRNAYPNRQITSFNTTCGISDEVCSYVSKLNKKVKYDLYIILDDNCKYVRSFDLDSAVENISIDIEPNSQFLTIAVVDSDDAIEYDWCILGHPTLALE